MSYYARVSRSDNEEPVQLPLDHEGTLPFNTLHMVFNGATGIKYRASDNGVVKSLYADGGRFFSPPEGWIYNFVCTYPADDAAKRRNNEPLENPTPNKTPKIEENNKPQDLIVLDLPYSVNSEDLRKYFSTFGVVAHAHVKMHPFTRQSRGFGFIRFEDQEVQNSVLTMEHTISDRKVNVKVPKAKKKYDPFAKGKLFVSNLTKEMTEDVIKEYFEKYGEITHVFVPKKPFRNFCFVTYAEPDIARTVCESTDHKINNVSLRLAPADQDYNRFGPMAPFFGHPGFYPFGFYGPGFNQYYHQYNKAARQYMRRHPRFGKPPKGTNPSESPEDALHRLRIEKMKLDGVEEYPEIYDYSEYRNLEFKEIDFRSAYEARDCLVLSGNIPEVRARENCINIVRNILKWKSYKDIDFGEIETAHRLGNRIQNPDQRSIIIKFKDPSVVPRIVSACKARKQDFYITEPIVLLKRTVSYVLRKAKEKFDKVVRVRLVSDKVTVDVKLPNSDEVREVIINSREELIEFLRTEVNSSVVEVCEGTCPFTERDIA